MPIQTLPDVTNVSLWYAWRRLATLALERNPSEASLKVKSCMRWKLLLVTSLLAAVAGAGASLVIIYALLGSTAARILSPDIPVAGALLIPVGFIIYAAIFVYRHTSRRRALQAITTVLFAIVLIAAAFAAASALLRK
ncbi:MAG: hypothetical protein H0U81_06420 [Pyrinomonadaceae bacterium]|nr:hypothetical protein [Pyrinomonadaceae bacterium]